MFFECVREFANSYPWWRCGSMLLHVKYVYVLYTDDIAVVWRWMHLGSHNDRLGNPTTSHTKVENLLPTCIGGLCIWNPTARIKDAWLSATKLKCWLMPVVWWALQLCHQDSLAPPPFPSKCSLLYLLDLAVKVLQALPAEPHCIAMPPNQKECDFSRGLGRSLEHSHVS